MASTNPFLHADESALTDLDGDVSSSGLGARRRGAGARPRAERQKSRNSQRQLRETANAKAVRSGWPEMEGLKPILFCLAVPAVLVILITLSGGHWPKPILYGIAIGLGTVVALSTFKTVELVLAIMLIYLPFSKVFVVPLAPGINGTNGLILLGLFAAVLRVLATRQKLTEFPPGTYLVFAFGFLTACSAFTVTLLPGGRANLLYVEFLSYKAWIDQFIFYFIVLMCVRDIETAKRCIIYVMIGSILVVLYSVPEMLEKSGRSTIDKSRIGGPHLQSNNFGGFVAYTLLPLVALFLTYIKDVRAWLLTPYFLVAAKVLITTFSRGAYVAMAAGAFLAAWYKGKGFLGWWTAVLLCFLLVFPSVIPESILVRMNALTEDTNSAAPVEEKLDKSSETRLIMWRAAALMIVEDPIWGKGFKAFPMLKDDYTEVPVHESDPHSMYFFIGAEMGLPSLALFIVILGYSFWLGRYHSQNKEDRFIRVIGIGGAAATACFAIVCLFGSRAVTVNFTVYFWTFLVVMQTIRHKQLEEKSAASPKRSRTNAFESIQASEGAAPEQRSGVRSAEPGYATAANEEGFLNKGWVKQYAGKKPRKARRGAAAFQAGLEAQTVARSNRPTNTISASPSRTKRAALDESELSSALARKSRRANRRFPSAK